MAEERNTPIENIYLQEEINLRHEPNAAAQISETEPTTYSVAIPLIEDLINQTLEVTSNQLGIIGASQTVSTSLMPTVEQIESDMIRAAQTKFSDEQNGTAQILKTELTYSVAVPIIPDLINQTFVVKSNQSEDIAATQSVSTTPMPTVKQIESAMIRAAQKKVLDEQNAAAQILQTEKTQSLAIAQENIDLEAGGDFDHNNETVFAFAVNDIKNTKRVGKLIRFLNSENIKPFDLTWRATHECCYLQYRLKPEDNITADNVASIIQNFYFAEDTTSSNN